MPENKSGFRGSCWSTTFIQTPSFLIKITHEIGTVESKYVTGIKVCVQKYRDEAGHQVCVKGDLID